LQAFGLPRRPGTRIPRRGCFISGLRVY